MYEDIISLENLFLAWREFLVGKKSRPDVQVFSRHLIDNIVALHEDLTSGIYEHGSYYSFYITDPKRRHIHKASVRDRLLHHALYRILYPSFDKIFIADSYSCRKNKGTHKALEKFRRFSYKVSKNNTRTCWVLKCDIRNFFASVDYQILLYLLEKRIKDQRVIGLSDKIISSFITVTGKRVGLPLGNLTSQLFANVYMNHFDQWMKHRLKCKYYIRYADDFVIFSLNKTELVNLIPLIGNYLQKELKLKLHPTKIDIRTIASGVDFIGWVHFPHHRLLRKTTRKRMFNRIQDNAVNQSLQSYLGLIGHGNTHNVQKELLNTSWFYNLATCFSTSSSLTDSNLDTPSLPMVMP